MAVLVFLSGPAWARVVPPHCLLHVDRHLALRVRAVGDQVGTARAHLAHVRFADRRLGRGLGLGGIPERDMRPEQEGEDILVEGLQHGLEQVEALALIRLGP